MPHNQNVDFKLTSEAKIQPVFTGREDMPVAFDFSLQGHALVTLYVQCLFSDWSKFDRRVDAKNRPLALRGHVTNTSLKQIVGVLLMPKIDRAHKNYLTCEI